MRDLEIGRNGQLKKLEIHSLSVDLRLEGSDLDRDWGHYLRALVDAWDKQIDRRN